MVTHLNLFSLSLSIIIANGKNLHLICSQKMKWKTLSPYFLGQTSLLLFLFSFLFTAGPTSALPPPCLALSRARSSDVAPRPSNLPHPRKAQHPIGSHYKSIIKCQLDPKGEEAIILYTHMHFITNKFHLYHSDYILQEL